eukprot:3306584-Pyramimonas_sp.AAC.1
MPCNVTPALPSPELSPSSCGGDAASLADAAARLTRALPRSSQPQPVPSSTSTRSDTPSMSNDNWQVDSQVSPPAPPPLRAGVHLRRENGARR